MTIRFLLIAGVAAVLSACNTAGPVRSPEKLPPEEAVAERALQRWKYIIANDLKASYEYITPGSKAAMPFQSYAMRMTQAQIRWADAEVVAVVCSEPGVCKAEVVLDITVHAPGVGQVATQTVQYEDWIESGGHWHYLPQSIQ